MALNKFFNINPAALNIGMTGGRVNLGTDKDSAAKTSQRVETTTDVTGRGKASVTPTTAPSTGKMTTMPQIRPSVPLTSMIPINARLAQSVATANVTPGISQFTPVFPTANLLPFLQLNKTTTQLARGAIKQLQDASAGTLNEAINTVKNRKTSPGGLINYLERRVKIGEVLNELAKGWDNETKEDFAGAFNMAATKFAVMDSIVSLAILNDPDLEDELLVENTPDTSESELMDNRRIVWQHPQPGTPLEPPYLMMVAVEYQDIADAREVADSILRQLTTREGFKLPKDIASRAR